MIFRSLFDDNEDEPAISHQASIHLSIVKDVETVTSETVVRGTRTEEIVTLGPIPVETVLVERDKNNLVKDREAFTRLFEQHNGTICTYLAHLVGNVEVGRDLAQDTFIKVWQNLPSLRDPSQVESWLFRIARNTAIDYLRQQKVRRLLIPWKRYEEYERSEYPSSEGFEDRISETECIKQALLQVKLKPRECLILYVIVGLSQRKIAELLEIQEQSVTTYVSTGRKEFRKAYERLKGTNDQ